MISYARMETGISISLALEGFLLEDEIQGMVTLVLNFISTSSEPAFVTVDMRNLRSSLNDFGKKRIINIINGRSRGSYLTLALIYTPRMIEGMNRTLACELNRREDTTSRIFTTIEQANEWMFPSATFIDAGLMTAV